MAYARWDPFRDLIAIQHRIERLTPTGPLGWAPAVDVCETAAAFIIIAELPGLTRDQIRISVHDGRLTLHGHRAARTAGEHYHQVERGRGEFARTFVLPPHVDSTAIAADLSAGVLTITVPKLAEAASRRVEVL